MGRLQCQNVSIDRYHSLLTPLSFELKIISTYFLPNLDFIPSSLLYNYSVLCCQSWRAMPHGQLLEMTGWTGRRIIYSSSLCPQPTARIRLVQIHPLTVVIVQVNNGYTDFRVPADPIVGQREHFWTKRIFSECIKWIICLNHPKYHGMTFPSGDLPYVTRS